MFEKSLTSSGLTEKEALLYDLLIENGPSPAGILVKKSKLKRGITYKTLYDLEEKGLVVKYTKGKKLLFKPNHPYFLRELNQNRLTQIKNQELTIEQLLPQLVSTFNRVENKPGIQTYEGIEGIKEVYKDTLKEGKEILAILQTSEVEPVLYHWLNTVYAIERTEKNIKAKVIVAKDEKSSEYIKSDSVQLRDTLLVPQNKFPIGIEVNIYGDKIAFMTFRQDTSHIGIIIHNALIAETMRALFNLAWERAAEYPQKI